MLIKNLTRLLCVLGLLLSAALAESLDETRIKAEKGDAIAQFNLGWMYGSGGVGVPRDSAESERWYRKAALQGNDEAQHNLAVIYHYGLGVPKDYAEAVKWYLKAAYQGNGGAHLSLALMYSNGTGVPKDLVQAHMWYNIAVASGSAFADEKLTSLEKEMTPERIAEAMKLARELFAKIPKKK